MKRRIKADPADTLAVLKACDRYITALRQRVYGTSDPENRPTYEDLDRVGCVHALDLAIARLEADRVENTSAAERASKTIHGFLRQKQPKGGKK